MEINGEQVSLTCKEADLILNHVGIFRTPLLVVVGQKILDARVVTAREHSQFSVKPPVTVKKSLTNMRRKLHLISFMESLRGCEQRYATDTEGTERHLIHVPMDRKEKATIKWVAQNLYEVAQEDTTDPVRRQQERLDLAREFFSHSEHWSEDPELAADMGEHRLEEALAELAITKGILDALNNDCPPGAGN